MDFSFSEEQTAMKKVARDFAEKEISPYVEEDEENHYFRKEIFEKMGELGFFGCVVPEEYGGTDAGLLATLLMTEEISRISVSWGIPFNAQAGPSIAILKWGTEAQKQEYLPKLARGEIIGSFAMTEPDTGSDLVSMRTTAVEKNDHFLINGSKMWITYATIADLGLLFVYTDKKKKHAGMTCFLIDYTNMPGITTTNIKRKLGLHSCPTGEVALEDVKVPKDRMLGNMGDGFKVIMSLLDYTRLGASARALGVGTACIEEVLKYTTERKAFGKKIIEFQMMQEQLAEMYVEHKAAQLLVYNAATNKDKGVFNRIDSSLAKYYAAEAAVKASGNAVKMFGSYGFSGEYKVERFFRDSKSFQIVEGTSNIHKTIIARNVLKEFEKHGVL